jgi:hypothetical protein
LIVALLSSVLARAGLVAISALTGRAGLLKTAWLLG